MQATHYPPDLQCNKTVKPLTEPYAPVMIAGAPKPFSVGPMSTPVFFAFHHVQIPYEVELVRCYVDNDTLGACICSRAKQLGACTVVMAKHPKGAVVEFFVGSVTSYCVHHATCPVVVLHVG